MPCRDGGGGCCDRRWCKREGRACAQKQARRWVSKEGAKSRNGVSVGREVTKKEMLKKKMRDVTVAGLGSEPAILPR